VLGETPVKNWSVDDFCIMLEHWGLQQRVAKIQEERIDGELVYEMADTYFIDTLGFTRPELAKFKARLAIHSRRCA
jgi:hypothetical protein